MILTVDIGNTNIVLAFWDGENIAASSRAKTDKNKTSDEYAVTLRNVAMISGIKTELIEGAIISSVVPPLNLTMKRAIKRAFGFEPLIVGPGIKTGLNIKIDDPSQLGSDFVCGAVSALAKYPQPTVIVDLGTATKFSVVDKNGLFLGGSIYPGIKISLDALSSNTAQLPFISLDSPPLSVIGTNSVDSMKSGIIYGTACMIDGIIDMYRTELGKDLTVVSTGGFAEYIIPYCKCSIIQDENIILDGLRILYFKNTK
ncbi:MAG: type III pantothenate kinase [Oscillospiraceae bacterium]|nr:type III pantothenate kinase [Oscillospiraceae bacterium]